MTYSPVTMPNSFLLTLKLATQGQIKGSSTKKQGKLDYSSGIECIGFQYGVKTPVDSDSGAASGRRQHSPITVRKEIDSASPLLFNASCTGEGFEQAKLTFDPSGPGPDGKTGLARDIELTNGAIVKIKLFAKGGKKYEDVTLSFEGLHVNGIADGLIPHVHLP